MTIREWWQERRRARRALHDSWAPHRMDNRIDWDRLVWSKKPEPPPSDREGDD